MLMLFPMVSSVAPITQVNLGDEGLQVFYPQLDYVSQNAEFKLHLHVSNISNGFPMYNDNVECHLHLYNSTGQHTYTNGLTKDANRWDHEVILLGGNFSDLGQHAFFIWCNNSYLGGEAKGVFEVTPTGEEFTTADSNNYLIIVIVVLAFLIASLYGFISIPFKNGRDDEDKLVSVNDLKYVKILLGFAVYGFFTWLANIMIVLTTNYVHLGVSLGFFTMMFKTMLWLMWPVVIITIVIIVWNMFNDMKLGKRLERGLS